VRNESINISHLREADEEATSSQPGEVISDL
jgi:hypothetical protein